MPARVTGVYMAKGQEKDRLLPTQSSFEGKSHSGREIRHRAPAWQVEKAAVAVHCISSAEDGVRAYCPGELGACLQVEEAAAFPASRLRFEFPKGSVCACIWGHGSAVRSVSRELSSKGFSQSLQDRLGVRKLEFSLIHHWHSSPEQGGSACVTHL